MGKGYIFVAAYNLMSYFLCGGLWSLSMLWMSILFLVQYQILAMFVLLRYLLPYVLGTSLNTFGAFWCLIYFTHALFLLFVLFSFFGEGFMRVIYSIALHLLVYGSLFTFIFFGHFFFIYACFLLIIIFLNIPALANVFVHKLVLAALFSLLFVVTCKFRLYCS